MLDSSFRSERSAMPRSISSGTEFSTAVQEYLKLAHADAYHTVKSLLQLKFGKQSDVIYFDDFKFWLEDHAQFFQNEDLENFLKDVEIGLKLEGDRVSICMISAMIEYDSECFPQ